MMKLEKWFVVGVIENPYIPPEAQIQVLKGEVYGNPKFQDGEFVHTSAIVKVEGKVITTSKGSQYELGVPDEDFVKWCQENDYHVPTPDEPIKLKGKPNA